MADTERGPIDKRRMLPSLWPSNMIPGPGDGAMYDPNFGLSPADFAAAVARYRQAGLPGGSPQQILGPAAYNQLMATPPPLQPGWPGAGTPPTQFLTNPPGALDQGSQVVANLLRRGVRG